MRTWWVVAMVGCAAPVAPHPVAPVANTEPVKPVGHAGLAMAPLAGPFASLDEVCRSLGPEPGACTYQEGPVTASVRVGDRDAPVRLEYIAVKAGTRWFVTSELADTANRYSSFSADSKRVGNAIVIRYLSDESTAGRFASTNEDGVIVCEHANGAIACTSKIAARRYRQWMDTNTPNWDSHVDVELACEATYKNGRVVLTPLPAPAFDDPTWTAEAAAACK